MRVMSMENTLRGSISHLLSRPRRDLSHLGGATTQKSSTQGAGWEDSGWGWPSWLRWWTARQGYCRFTFCAVALGQRLHDSDATLKAFLSRRQAVALQSKQRLWVTFRRAQLLGCDSMPTHYSWRVVCLVCVSQLEGCHCWRSVCTCTHCFLTSHYLTTLMVIFYTGSLIECSVLISAGEGVEKWTCASFVAHATDRKGNNKHQNHCLYANLQTQNEWQPNKM